MPGRWPMRMHAHSVLAHPKPLSFKITSVEAPESPPVAPFERVGRSAFGAVRGRDRPAGQAIFRAVHEADSSGTSARNTPASAPLSNRLRPMAALAKTPVRSGASEGAHGRPRSPATCTARGDTTTTVEKILARSGAPAYTPVTGEGEGCEVRGGVVEPVPQSQPKQRFRWGIVQR